MTIHAVPTPPPATQDQVREQLVIRYLDLQEQINEMREQQESIKRSFRDDLGTGGEFKSKSGVKVSVSPTRRFNEKKAREILTPEQVEACTAPAFQSSLAREQLPPAVYKACMVEVGDPTVRIA